MTISLRCVSWLVKFPLPSLNKHVPTMGKLLFNILKNYAKAGAKVGENFEMLISAFKVRMRVLSFRILIKENVLSGNFSTRRVGWNTGMAWLSEHQWTGYACVWAPYASEDDHRQLYLCFFTLFIRAICARNCLPRDGQIYYNTEQGKNKLCRAKIIIITNFFGMHFYKCRKCI